MLFRGLAKDSLACFLTLLLLEATVEVLTFIIMWYLNGVPKKMYIVTWLLCIIQFQIRYLLWNLKVLKNVQISMEESRKSRKPPKKSKKKTLARDLFPVNFKISCLGGITPWQGKLFFSENNTVSTSSLYVNNHKVHRGCINNKLIPIQQQQKTFVLQH